MQKRNNPLDVKQEKTDFKKRENPLVLEKKQVVVKSEIAMISDHKLLTLNKTLKPKRKLVLTSINKALLEAVKRIDPKQKLGMFLEESLINYLNQLDKDKHKDLIEKFGLKETAK